MSGVFLKTNSKLFEDVSTSFIFLLKRIGAFVMEQGGVVERGLAASERV